MAAASAQAQSLVRGVDRSILEFPDDLAAPNEFAATEGGAYGAVVSPTKSGRFVVLTDAGRSKEHEAIWSLVAAPGPEARFAWAARDRNEETGDPVVRVFCGKEAGPAMRQLLEGPCFDPSGKRLAYVGVMENHRWQVVLDGKVLEDCERRSFAFAPKGGGWACAEERRLRWSARFGTYTGGACDDVSLLTVSPDGERVAWAGRVGKDAFVMCDGVRGPDFVRISELVWTPSGKEVLYCGQQKADSDWTIVRGKEETRVSNFVCDLQLSGDEKRLLYWTAESTLDERWSLVCDGTALGRSFDHGPAAFSPDGRTVAWVRTDGDGVRWLKVGDGEARLDGRVESLEWSADGSAVSFAVCGERSLTWATVRIAEPKDR